MNKLSFKRLALVALFIISGFKIYATEADFQVNGIYYKITSIEERECSVYGPVYPENNPTKLIIPTEVTYNGASFTVVSVFGESQLRTKRSRYVNVKELILPNSVKMIEYSAFYNVRSLERIQMDGVEYISDNAFESCENLKTVSIALNRLKYIGFAGFSDCRSFEKIIIPPSCKKIEKSAFLGCVNPRLTVVIEDSDEPLLCNSTFGSGRKIYIGRNIQGWYGLGDAARHTYHNDIYYFKEIEFGDKVTEMLGINLTRRNYDDLENFPFKITIGASIREVPDFANDDMTIQSLYLVSAVPPHVKGAFSNRTYLRGTLYVPKGSLAAYKDAPIWKNFLNIQEYETERTIAAQKADEGKRAAEEAQKAEAERKAKAEAERKAKEEADRIAKNPVIPDGTTEIPAYAYKGKPIKTITIPNTVTRIGDGAFENCYSLTSISIPDKVTSIGNSAFKECKNINSIRIPNSVTSIGDEAFEGCRFLMFLTIGSGVKNIGERAFKYCYGIKSLTIPNSVTKIGEGAFLGCSSIKSVIIPNGVTSIEDETFSRCSDMISISIPSSVMSIGEKAFFNCYKLISIAIPEGVVTVGDKAFYGCRALTSVTLPNSLISIEDGVFTSCINLSSIDIPKSVTSIGENAFQKCTNLEISIPKKWKGKVNLSDCKSVKYY